MKFEKVFLSHLLHSDTPSYGNRNKFIITKNAAIAKGDIANDSSLKTTTHIGTHIDMPYHFYGEGQTIEDYPAQFWSFLSPLLISLQPRNLIIFKELIEKIEAITCDANTEILLVKTGIEKYRGLERFWLENPGFSPDLYGYLVKKFPKLKVFGFDSISISSFANRKIGREAHKSFLNPQNPVLLLEDMHLAEVDETTILQEVMVAPMRIADCDGLPCTVIASVGGEI